MTNGLKSYDWDTRYSSGTHNLIEDFFVPALERSRFYYRVAGYFSSTSIAAALRGVSSFVNNGEKMYLIVGSQLFEKDVEAISKGELEINDLIEKSWEECLNEAKDDLTKKRFQILSWLIANNKLEVRVGFSKSDDGKILTSEKSKFHEKILIFEDYEGNCIQLDGSINETVSAWKNNRESFCVHKSWIEGNNEFIDSAKKEFDKMWLNNDKTCEIIDLPEASKKQLIEKFDAKSPLSIKEEIELETTLIKKEKVPIKEKKLRKYQEEGVEAWAKNNHVGLFEMATGTGKTFTSLKAMETLPLKNKYLLIVVPQRELATQWADSCEEVYAKHDKRIIVCSGETDWKNNLARELRQTQRNNSLGIIITLINTLRTQDFKNAIKNIMDDTYLIADEVHEMGSEVNRKLFDFLSPIKIRLGLSATPDRVWDDDGNDAIQEYFGGKPIFSWDMEKAINPPEGYERCLTPYKYYIHETNLSEEELTEYEELSSMIKRKIAILSKGGKVKINEISDTSLELLKFKRSNIIKKCHEKYSLVSKIIDEHSESFNKCLIYCSDEKHMSKVGKILSKKGLKARKFYGELNQDAREKIFDSFKNDDVQFVVAIKCLDQGVDLPFCDSAIILTSSTNPREYVQRRGRILRLYEGKELANIHDVIVFPYEYELLKQGKKKISEEEAKILDNQLKRMDLFMENSVNKGENLLKKLDYGEVIVRSLHQDG